ncbi:hypothetical protein IV102_22425 [bacterium]|nr:hypothetical protein [bacterium]
MHPRRAGLSLLEVVLTSVFFAALSLVAWLAMSSSVSIWARASGRDEAHRNLIKAISWFRRDLVSARLSATTFQQSALQTTSGCKEGDAIGFLSPIDPGSDQLTTKTDGTPFMMRTIVYYLAAPRQDPCQQGSDGSGYEGFCPHKILVRRVLDSGTPTLDPSQMASEESLDPGWPNWLERPDSFQLIDEQRQLLAINLLTFRVQEQGPVVRIELRAVSLLEARQKRVAVGTVNLSDNPATVRRLVEIIPRN